MENRTKTLELTKKYYLDFDPFDSDEFCLITCDEHDVVFTGSVSEIIGDADDPWEVLDNYFEKELNIKSEEWEVG